MDSSVALLSSPASLGFVSSKLKELKAKRRSRCGAEQESSGVASPALSSSTTAVPAHSLLRTISIEAPTTPRMNSSCFRTRLFRRSSSEEHTFLLGSAAGQSTQKEAGVLPHRSSTTVYAYHAHSSTHSTQQATSSNSSEPRKQVGCELPLATRIKRRFAWTAKVVQRRASCPATMQLQHLPTSSTSNEASFPEAAPLQQQQQQQQQAMQPLMTSHPLCSSQSWPGRHPVLTTGFSSAAVEHPNTPPPAAAAAAPTQSPASFGSGSSVSVAAWQPPPPCSEISVCDDSSDNSSAGAPDSLHSQAQHEAGSGGCPPAESYPKCLFSDNPSRISSSFTTTVHINNKGQKVAVVRSVGTIIAAFVKGPSGQVWECDPVEVDFTGSSGSQTQTAAAGNGTECAAVSYTGDKASSGVLTAYAAARAYHALNRSSSSSSSGGSRRGCGSSISSASEISPSSRSSGGSNSWFSSRTSAGGMPGACSRTASSKSSVSGLSCSSSHSSTASNQQQRRSLFAVMEDRIAEWRQQCKVQQLLLQRQAAAYLEELDHAARLSMRLAGCGSFVLPRHWSDSARKQATEQRRLRVLLAAYRA